MSSFDSSTHTPALRKRSRRRVAAWVAFGVAGLAAGAVWATGFATIGGAQGTNVASPIVAPSTPADHTANLNGVITAGSTLTYNWQGRWGAIADTQLFTVDLTGKPAGNTYNIAFLLTNGAALSSHGWTSLQLKVERVDKAASGTCSASDYDGTNNPQVMAFDSEDAGVYWNGLAGDAVYCIGVNAGDGHDTLGTFLRSDSDTTPPTVYPSFVATVDQAS